jgi:hypothetical protein
MMTLIQLLEIAYCSKVWEGQHNPLFNGWKSDVTMMSTDENSHSMSYLDDACTWKERQKVTYAWWMLSGGQIKNLKSFGW